MHKDTGKSTKMIFHPGVAEIPDTHPWKSSSAPTRGDSGLFELKLCTGLQAAFEL